MKISFLTTEESILLSSFKERLLASEQIMFTSAFGSMGGLNLIKDEFQEFISKAGAAQFIFDISQGMTDPKLIEELATYPGEVKIKICVRDANNSFLHAKLYLFEGSSENSILTGSSNFSQGGMVKNRESCVLIDNPAEELFTQIKDYTFDIWNSDFSINPVVHPQIFEEYVRLNELWKKNNFESVAGAGKLKELSAEIRKLNDASEYLNNNLDVNYLLGVLAASAKYQSIRNAEKGVFELRFSSHIHNGKSDTDRGYITNVVDGSRLGNIKLPQIQTMINYLNRMSLTISKFLETVAPDTEVISEDTSKNNIMFKITINFKSPNPVWEGFLNYVRSATNSDGKVIAILPKNINKINPDIGLHFFKGYADFRGRVSHADRAGTSGNLRIALQVDKDASKFLYETEKYLEKNHQMEVNVNDGSQRGKNNMLRITASPKATELFQSGWQRQMAYLFSEYNISQ